MVEEDDLWLSAIAVRELGDIWLLYIPLNYIALRPLVHLLHELYIGFLNPFT